MAENFFIGGINVVLLVFGLVEFIKSLGVKGSLLTMLSLAFGVLFGIAWQVVSNGLPASLADWIVTVALGLAFGLTASGVYDFLSPMRYPAQGGFEPPSGVLTPRGVSAVASGNAADMDQQPNARMEKSNQI